VAIRRVAVKGKKVGLARKKGLAIVLKGLSLSVQFILR
jgi:hypothetical protein